MRVLLPRVDAACMVKTADASGRGMLVVHGTAAAQVRACHAQVTDLFGAPLIYDADAPVQTNRLGVIASRREHKPRHQQLCTSMRADGRALALLQPWMGSAPGHGEEAPSGQPTALAAQAADLCRELGASRPLSCEWLAERLGAAPGELRGWDACEDSAFRGHMSTGCRLRLRWSDCNAEHGASSSLAGAGGTAGGPQPAAGRERPPTVFYKRIVMSELEATRAKAVAAPLKLARDVRSRARPALRCREPCASSATSPRAACVPSLREVDPRVKPTLWMLVLACSCCECPCLHALPGPRRFARTQSRSLS